MLCYILCSFKLVALLYCSNDNVNMQMTFGNIQNAVLVHVPVCNLMKHVNVSIDKTFIIFCAFCRQEFQPCNIVQLCILKSSHQGLPKGKLVFSYSKCVERNESSLSDQDRITENQSINMQWLHTLIKAQTVQYILRLLSLAFNILN